MTPNPFNSMRIVVSPDRPGYVLPEDLPLPDEFRAQFNAWAFSFFNHVQVIPDNVVHTDVVRGVLMMNPRTFEAFKKATK